MSREISFVITARNESEAVLAATIDGLLRTSERHNREVIVVDDGSDTPVRHAREHVRVMRNAEPVGVSRSRRYGAATAEGEVLVWLDAHMTFAPDWLEQMLAHVDSGSLLCSAFWDYEQTVCHCWGADFVWQGQRDYHAQLYPGFGLRHRTEFPGWGAFDVPMVIGACYMLLRASYDRLHGFSPLFRVWGVDEQDMSVRAWLAGLGVRCVTNARVGHLWRPRFPYPVQFEHLEFNQLVMARTVFEEATARLLEACFQPIPATVRAWVERTDLSAWRTKVQSSRLISDQEFFGRFLPSSPIKLEQVW
jgi:glycosyltransferase involved in cell wall biosynthesis